MSLIIYPGPLHVQIQILRIPVDVCLLFITRAPPPYHARMLLRVDDVIQATRTERDC
jgi:hypothetical protein